MKPKYPPLIPGLSCATSFSQPELSKAPDLRIDKSGNCIVDNGSSNMAPQNWLFGDQRHAIVQSEAYESPYKNTSNWPVDSAFQYLNSDGTWGSKIIKNNDRQREYWKKKDRKENNSWKHALREQWNTTCENG